MAQQNHKPDDSAALHAHAEGYEVHAHQPDSPLKQELLTHLPFSVASVAIGLVMAGIICFLAPTDLTGAAHPRDGQPVHGHTPHAMCEHDHEHDHTATQEAASTETPSETNGHDHDHDHVAGFLPMFHLFHPLHMFFSAAATTAMFWRYDRKLFKAIMVGLAGAIVVCGISDILMPHVSVGVLGLELPLHICVIEHPGLVLPFAVIGIGVGLTASVGVARSTIFSHAIHVFVSTMASIFYIVNAYGRLAWIGDIGWVFFFVILAVMIHCCFSDIIFPLAMTRKARAEYSKTACCHGI